MAYYLGRDIDIAITTESAYYSVCEVTSTGTVTAGCLDMREDKGAAGTQFAEATHKSVCFAGPRTMADSSDKPTNAADNPWAGTITGGGASSPAADTDLKATSVWTNVPTNITGLDLSFGVMDEDVAFVGQRNILKAEVKKDNSVTLTRKKADTVWNTIYNHARFGLIDHDDTEDNSATNLVVGSASFHQGLDAPDFQQYGYRVYLRFGGSTSADEIFVLRNCCVTDYSVTMGADSVQEESITLQSYVDPIIRDGTVDATLYAITPLTAL